MKDSILWTNSTEERDRILVRSFIERFFGKDGWDNAQHEEKIMRRIRTPDWQTRFPVRNFVFFAHYANQIRIVELRTSLFMQSLDALYPYLVPAQERGTDLSKERYATKLSNIARTLYGRKFNKGTCGAVEIVRNHLMHTASLTGLMTPRGEGTSNALIRFVDRKILPRNPHMSEVQGIRFFVRALPACVDEIILRALGLEDEDIHRSSGALAFHPWFLGPVD